MREFESKRSEPSREEVALAQEVYALLRNEYERAFDILERADSAVFMEADRQGATDTKAADKVKRKMKVERVQQRLEEARNEFPDDTAFLKLLEAEVRHVAKTGEIASPKFLADRQAQRPEVYRNVATRPDLERVLDAAVRLTQSSDEELSRQGHYIIDRLALNSPGEAQDEQLQAIRRTTQQNLIQRIRQDLEAGRADHQRLARHMAMSLNVIPSDLRKELFTILAEIDEKGSTNLSLADYTRDAYIQDQLLGFRTLGDLW